MTPIPPWLGHSCCLGKKAFAMASIADHLGRHSGDDCVVGHVARHHRPAPTIAKRPIVVPQMMVAFDPIEAPRRMRVGTTDQSVSVLRPHPACIREGRDRW
jgi:hypothetical protein